MVTRRLFLKTSAMAGAATLLPWKTLLRRAYAQIPGGTLEPADVSKYTLELVKPPAMPRSRTIRSRGRVVHGYDIAVRQFSQRILSTPHPETTVWSYGSVQNNETFNYPAFTIEAKHGTAVRVDWRNELVDDENNFLPHILPVDQTLHWANPPGPPDDRGTSPAPYSGPVPMVTHVHGAHTTQESDGYPEAWYLPDAENIPFGLAKEGTFYPRFKSSSPLGGKWGPGRAVFEYPNDQRATTLWYHDHTLGMTRLNVYAGPAGFYLIRGGAADRVRGKLPGPAPGVGDDPFGEFGEIPIVIQDRSFNANDGSLFYPDNRAFFERLHPADLQIPFIPSTACGDDPSDVPPIWNPEFFGNMMVVNGRTWPYVEVEQRRYRLRFLNGCNSRFLVLKMTTTPRTNNDGFNTPEGKFWQIGSEGGFLPQVAELDQLLIAPAERADVIVDFSEFNVGDDVILVNDGPDAPFGGIPELPFEEDDIADHASTGQVMMFKVVAATSRDRTTPPMDLELPRIAEPGFANATRGVRLFEEDSQTVLVTDVNGRVELDCANGEPFGPTAALLGTPSLGWRLWSDPITENPSVGTTEEWQISNITEDAHPIHVHLVQFRVLGRGADGNQPPELWETGWKDTVIAYPGEITRIQAKFDIPGLYVWHCHIVEHEDNEMMRPYRVVGPPAGA